MEKEIRTKILAKIGLLHKVTVGKTPLAIEEYYLIVIDDSYFRLQERSIKELGLDEAISQLVRAYKEGLC